MPPHVAVLAFSFSYRLLLQSTKKIFDKVVCFTEALYEPHENFITVKIVNAQ